MLMNLNFPQLTLNEELEIGRQLMSGDFSRREELINSNLKLVVSIAKQYINRGLDLDDLISYGTIGLINAVDKYNYKLGLKLSTSATNWIRQSIGRALQDETRSIRLPEYIINSISKMNKVRNEFVIKNGQLPTDEELSKQLDLTIEEVRELKSYSQNTISLQTSLNDEDDATLEDTCASEYESPVEYVERTETEERVEKLLSKLDERSRKIVELRFGLNGNDEHTLEEIGELVGMSKMGVSKVLTKQLELMKSF